ncbi:hypothetical protein [Massilia timonae]|uniref:hypothetical protein n=1 Tax=Massilia timonae TaxID=47229 RepID=UPI0028D5CFE2|nr:hypothetical protein [Massilia timonae]
MHVERVRFDRVFDVRKRLKEFSFEEGGWPVYGVSALGLGIPREGATYAVAFRERGNWETVVGWRDLSTSKVTLRRSSLAAVTQPLPLVAPLVPGVFAVADKPGASKAFLSLAVLVLLGAVAYAGRAVTRNRRAAKILRGADAFVDTEERP